jgi:hypothetical protein
VIVAADSYGQCNICGLEVAVTSGRAFSRSVRRDFFDLVCRGVPLKYAAQNLGVSPGAGWIWWHDAGAMKLIRGSGAAGLANPGDLVRPGGRGRRVSFEERVEIMRGLDAKLSFAEIAERIGRDRSVVCREYQRNCLPDGDYHALMAHAYASERARRPKRFKLRDHPLCRVIEDWMDDGWSPKLIADVLARDHGGDKLMRVSHETILDSGGRCNKRGRI